MDEDFYPNPGGGSGGTALTPPDSTLLASTIDGTLVAIDQVPILPNSIFSNFTHICEILLQICVKFLTNL
jgi:hypothetical protein